MYLILVLILFIYLDIAIFISVYVYCRIAKEYKTVPVDDKIYSRKMMNKIKNSLLFKAMLVGIFFPVTLPVLAAVLIAARQEGI